MDIARFWLDKGVDGFRLDVVNFYFHDQELRDNPPRTDGTTFATQFEGEDEYSKQQHIFDKSRPENLAFLRRFRSLMDRYPGTFTIGEIGDDHPYARAAEYTAGDEYLHTTYNTHLMSGTHKALTPDHIREPFEQFANQPGDGWPSWAFSNHDVVRAASRWHEDGDGFSHDPALSKMLIALLLCLRGTVFLYQGEELGLPEAKLDFDDLQDPWGRHLWPAWQGRDGCRTPIPWTRSNDAPSWLPVPDSHLPLCAEKQLSDEGSCLAFTRAFLKIRSQHNALKHGEIDFIPCEHDQVLWFERCIETERIMCLFNLSGQEQKINVPQKTEDLASLGATNKDEGIKLGAYGFLIGLIRTA